MSGADTPGPAAFQEVIEKLARREGFMAHVLRQVFAGDVSASRIAHELGCSESAAIRLALMRVPAADRFRADVAKIASDTGIPPARLTAAIRQAGALGAFAAPATSGLLMAARDYHHDDNDDEGQ
jgi:hypothetical protein